jgi:hypothetical protein
VSALAIGCSSSPPAAIDTGGEQDVKSKVKATAAERAAYLARAEIVAEDAVPNRSPDEIKAGPPGQDAFAFNAEVACDFVEPDKNDQLGGMTQKFNCKLASGEIVKVKYSRTGHEGGPLTAGANDEVYAEVIGTRLLWSIGLPADRMYPVRVTCRNCPEEPWAAYVHAYGTLTNKLRFPSAGSRDTRRFESAVIERKFGAPKIEGPDGEAGWGWDELPARPDTYFKMNAADRATFDQAHPEQVRFDALRLFAAWIKHADNKAANQRLVCDKLAADGTCARPLLMIQDLGVTFGGGTELGGLLYTKVSKASLAGWSKTEVWDDLAECEASLAGSRWSGTLTDPHVSNAGRAMLLQRLGALSDEQLHAIFEAARIEEKGEKLDDPTTGASRPVTSDDWVRTYRTMLTKLDVACAEP